MGSLKSAKHNKFLKNTVWQYGLQFVKHIFPFITLPYLTRVLEPEGYAVYAYVLSFMSILHVILEFGFNLSGTKQVAESSNDIPELNRVVGSILQGRVLLTIVVFLAFIPIIFVIPLLRNNVLYVLLAYGAVSLKAALPDFVFMGLENMKPLTTRYFFSKSVSTLLTFVLVHSVSDLIYIPILDIVSGIIALVWSFNSMKKLFGVGITLCDFKTVFRGLRTSAIYCTSNIASRLLSGSITIAIGLVIADQTQISYWSISVTAVSAIQSLYTPITNSLYPHMINTPDVRFAKKLAVFSFLPVVVGSILFYGLSDWIVLVIGGAGYVEGAHVLRLIAPVLLLSYYSLFFGWPILGAIGRVTELTLTTILAGTFTVVALLVTSLSGFACIMVICIIRCLGELVLCLSRYVFVVYFVRKQSREGE